MARTLVNDQDLPDLMDQALAHDQYRAARAEFRKAVDLDPKKYQGFAFGVGIGIIVGIVIIVAFALMIPAHPILMATVWNPLVYDPVIGYDEIVVEKQVVEEVTDPSTQIQVDIAKLDYYHLNPELGDTITIRGSTKGRTTYRVVVDGSIRDTFGQTLGEDQ